MLGTFSAVLSYVCIHSFAGPLIEENSLLPKLDKCLQRKRIDTLLNDSIQKHY